MGYHFAHPRRRSNSSTAPGLTDFKTKFETIEQEPVFEEELHGPGAADDDEPLSATTNEKDSSAESMSGISVEEEERAKKL